MTALLNMFVAFLCAWAYSSYYVRLVLRLFYSYHANLLPLTFTVQFVKKADVFCKHDSKTTTIKRPVPMI